MTPGADGQALILDCDGVLADTERYGHLVAFNQTFDEFGLPVHWSLDDYRAKVLIGGGKERLASLLTPEFVAAAGLPSDPAGQQAVVAAWHQRKTEIYTELVTSGAVPPRSGIARIVGEALAAGWRVAVASTSAEPSVVATLNRAVGPELARQVKVFAGDIVTKKKPAPDIYLVALDWLGLPAGQVVVIEDSRNGLLAATGAGLATVVTVNDLTKDEDFSEAALVVSALGDPGGERAQVLANRTGSTPGDWITLADLSHVRQGAAMPKATFGDVETVVHTIATTAVENEKYFGDLDAVVGDGDFGYSMARGFELVVTGWDDFDRTDIGTFLKKIAVMITSRIGGTSGPIWGTAFLRAGTTAGAVTELDRRRLWPCSGPRPRASRPAVSPTSGTRRCWTRWSRRPTRSSAASPMARTRRAPCGRRRRWRGRRRKPPAHGGQARPGQLHRRAEHRNSGRRGRGCRHHVRRPRRPGKPERLAR